MEINNKCIHEIKNIHANIKIMLLETKRFLINQIIITDPTKKKGKSTFRVEYDSIILNKVLICA